MAGTYVHGGLDDLLRAFESYGPDTKIQEKGIAPKFEKYLVEKGKLGVKN